MNKTSSSINYKHRQANEKKLMHQIVRQHVACAKKKKIMYREDGCSLTRRIQN